MSQNPIAITNSQESDRIFANRPILSSQSLGWQGIEVKYRQMPGMAMPEMYAPWHNITFLCSMRPGSKLVRRCGGKQWVNSAQVGEAMIIPATMSYGGEWENEIETLTLMLDVDAFAGVIDESQDATHVEIIPQLAQVDPLLFHLGLGLKSILESGAEGQRLYAESLTHTLMVHILQHYTTRVTHPKTYGDGLAKVKLQLVLDYIQGHLDRDLGLKELASLVQLSPHYFSHLFKQSVGIPPHQYVVQQRVERAKQLLKRSHMTISEIAYGVGFANQAHLNRHFKRFTGITPGAFRRG